MKHLKRMSFIVLALAMMIFPNFYANAAETQEIVTRAQWLENLTTMFDMTIVSENMPDNYFSDLDETSEYYEAVMLAVEFGVVDIEAGGEIRPEDPCTREFAASTLNYCLGFQLDEGTDYTFSDSAQCQDPDSAQVAVNRGWFALNAGAFLPDQIVTSDEVSAMVEDTETVLESSYVDDNYESTYVFADYVVEIPEGTEVFVDENDVVTITGVAEEIAAGDTFVIYPSELPSLYVAEEVTISENVMTITTTEADEDSAIVSIDASGSVEVDLSQFEEAEGVEAAYVRTAADVSSAIQTYGIEVEKDSVIATKDIEVGEGIEVSIVVNLSDLKLHHNIQTLKGNYYVAVSGTSTISGNVSVDEIKAAGGETNVVIGTVNVMGVGKVTVSVDLELNGEVTVTYTGDFETGAQYQKDDGFRLVTSFKKKTFSTEAEANSKIGVNVLFGVDIIAAKAELNATTGLAARVESDTYGDGKLPDNCTNISGWLYADVKAKAKLGVGSFSKTYSKSKTVYKESNSPVYVSFHWEDSKRVYECTRSEEQADKYQYFTKDDSPYGTSFYGGGSSVGVGYNGEPFTIFKYALDNSQNATITGYLGNVSVLNIPESIDGYKVTKIGYDCFRDNTVLRVVIFPDTVEEIEENAFWGCLGLSMIRFSDSLTTIQNNAFFECDSLREVEIPKSLTMGGSFGSGGRHGAFRFCSGLKTVRFEEGTTAVAPFLFANCDGLEEVVLPDTITEIGAYAFENCTNLTEVVFSKNVTKINEHAFKGCGKLESIELPEQLKEIRYNAFDSCTALTKLELPDSVTVIGENAFAGCSSLAEVKLSKALTTLENNAFLECDALTEITIPKSLTTGGSFGSGGRRGAFRYCSGLKTAYFEEGITKVPAFLFANCDGLETVKLPSSVQKIEGYAFENCNALTKIIIPKTTTVIEENAFTYPNNVTIYGISGSYAETFADEHSIPFVALSIFELSDVYRIAGTTRYETSLKIAEVLKAEQKVDKFNTVVIASGRNFPDALAGSYLARKLNAPILMANEKPQYADPLRAFIKENLEEGGTIYVLGGTGAVPESVLEGLEAFNIKRLAGTTRYETNLLILDEAGVANEDILVCTGRGFADSLSASATGRPILLVGKSLTEEQIKFMKEHRGNQYYIIGGTGAVSSEIQTVVNDYGTTKRLSGASRYETSILVAETFFENPTTAILASAKNFPDGLCGGPLAMSKDAPLILTATGKDASAVEYVKTKGISVGAVLGGDGLISDEATKSVFGSSEITIW